MDGSRGPVVERVTDTPLRMALHSTTLKILCIVMKSQIKMPHSSIMVTMKTLIKAWTQCNPMNSWKVRLAMLKPWMGLCLGLSPFTVSYIFMKVFTAKKKKKSLRVETRKTVSFIFSFMIHVSFCLHSMPSHYLIVPFLGLLSNSACYAKLYYICDLYMFIGK